MTEYRTLCINPANPHEEIRKLEADIEWMDAEHRPTRMHRIILAEIRRQVK